MRTLSYIENSVERDLYAEMRKLNHWSSRTLNGRIKSMPLWARKPLGGFARFCPLALNAFC